MIADTTPPVRGQRSRRRASMNSSHHNWELGVRDLSPTGSLYPKSSGLGLFMRSNISSPEEYGGLGLDQTMRLVCLTPNIGRSGGGGAYSCYYVTRRAH